jgi:polyprenyl-phospho-N-acetylgalactosaminyl synthase
MPRPRRALLRLAVWFTRLTSGVRISDAHNGLRAFTRRAAARLEVRLDRMAHASEIVDQVVRSGLPWVEVPVAVRYTEYSRRKGQPAGAAFRIAFDYIVSRLGGRAR